LLTVDAVTTEYETSGMGIETSRLLVMLSVRVYLFAVFACHMGMLNSRYIGMIYMGIDRAISWLILSRGLTPMCLQHRYLYVFIYMYA
jgi:hypothetical protein